MADSSGNWLNASRNMPFSTEIGTQWNWVDSRDGNNLPASRGTGSAPNSQNGMPLHSASARYAASAVQYCRSSTACSTATPVR